jgi:hypothetical protein
MAGNVQPLITSAQGYATTLVGQAGAAMTAAQTAVAAVGFIVPVPHPVTFGEDPPRATDVTLPVHPDIEFVVPPEPPNDMVFQDLDKVDTTGKPDPFAGTRPDYIEPNKPVQLPDFTDDLQPLNISSIIFPEPPPELLYPTGLNPAPIIIDRPEPTKIGTITIPAFEGVKPVDETVVPFDHEKRFETAFKGKSPEMMTAIDGLVDAMLAKRNPQYAAQMAAIETQLAKYLAGGTGLNATVENAIYERSKTKTISEARRVQQAAMTDFASRGFTMPAGALASAMQQARQAGADNNAQAAREIVVLQAEMEQKNLQFAVTTSIGLRTAMVQATLSYHQNLTTINGQALDYAKSVLSAIIEVYNTQVKMYGAQLDAYKAEAAVYDVRVRAAMVQVERYLAEVKGLEAMTQVDMARVNIYRARIEALTSYAAVYRAQIEAVQGKVNLEKTKLDIFQTQVQAYTAQVQGKNAEWQGYSAAIGGQTAKINAYTSEVQAYNAEYQGYKINLDAQNESMQLRLNQNQAKAVNYKAKFDLFKTVVDARGTVATTKLAVQRQDLLAFQEKVSLALADANLKHQHYTTKSNVDLANEANNMKAQIEDANSRRSYGQSIAQLGTANAQIYSGVASAAMSGMNTLVGDIANAST